jgi:hypothetical protein
MENKQTAVDFLIKEFSDILGPLETKPMQDLLMMAAMKQAKEMEKEQMVNAFEESRLTHPMIGFKHETFVEYYKKTFNTNEK